MANDLDGCGASGLWEAMHEIILPFLGSDLRPFLVKFGSVSNDDRDRIWVMVCDLLKKIRSHFLLSVGGEERLTAAASNL